MSEKPILFNTAMVKAIMEGKKTITRRLIKAKSRNAAGFCVTFRESDNQFMGVYDYDENEVQFESSQAPPYQVGDILYVRETWRDWDNDLCTCYECHGCKHKDYIYKAEFGDDEDIKWRPSIHMPKEAARIFLRVTNVRVERLKDITEEDIQREGVKEKFPPLAEDEFRDLWNSTIKKDDLDSYSFEANPWVWVIEFEVVTKDIETDKYIKVFE